jgi:hypothetical protein
MKNVFMLLLITARLVACSPTDGVSPRADNFAFVFQSSPCGPNPVNVLDTSSGTLVYTPLGGTRATTISLRLTDDELESIYKKAISINFFEYPSEFIVPEDQVLGYEAPAASYQLSMTNGELTNSVSWRDDTITTPGYTKADQLRELMKMIEELIQSYPEVQDLPEPEAGCV